MIGIQHDQTRFRISSNLHELFGNAIPTYINSSVWMPNSAHRMQRIKRRQIFPRIGNFSTDMAFIQHGIPMLRLLFYFPMRSTLTFTQLENLPLPCRAIPRLASPSPTTP
jgi:hypothetical protein